MMCERCRVLMRSSIDASVVDLPEPVGPVTSTRPRGRSHMSETVLGRPSSSSGRIVNGTRRNAPATAPRCMNRLARNRARPFTPNEKSSSCASSKAIFCASVRTE